MRRPSPIPRRLPLALLLLAPLPSACDSAEVAELIEELGKPHRPPPPPPAPTIELRLGATADVAGRNDDFVVLSPTAASPRPFAELTVTVTGGAARGTRVELSASGGGQVSLDPPVLVALPGKPAIVRVFGDRPSDAVDDVVVRARAVAGRGAEATEDLTVIDGVALAFEGHFQDRLATDPDPHDHPRGQLGSTRALEGEADLDNVIRFSNPVDLRFACAFDPVRISRVVAARPAGATFDGGDPALGQILDLGPTAKFVDPDGDLNRERIDGFELRTPGLVADGPDPVGGRLVRLTAAEAAPYLQEYRDREALLVAERARLDPGSLEARRIDARLALRATFQYDRWQILFSRPFVGRASATATGTAEPRSQLLTLLQGANGLDYRMDVFAFEGDCLRGRVTGTLRPADPETPPPAPLPGDDGEDDGEDDEDVLENDDVLGPAPDEAAIR